MQKWQFSCEISAKNFVESPSRRQGPPTLVSALRSSSHFCGNDHCEGFIVLEYLSRCLNPSSLTVHLLSFEKFGNAMPSITGPAWTLQKNAHTRKKYCTKDVNRSLNTGQQLLNFRYFERADTSDPFRLWQFSSLSLLKSPRLNYPVVSFFNYPSLPRWDNWEDIAKGPFLGQFKQPRDLKESILAELNWAFLLVTISILLYLLKVLALGVLCLFFVRLESASFSLSLFLKVSFKSQLVWGLSNTIT